MPVFRQHVTHQGALALGFLRDDRLRQVSGAARGAHELLRPTHLPLLGRGTGARDSRCR